MTLPVGEETSPDEKPVQVDSGPRPEDGDQSLVSQDPNDDYSGDPE